MTKDEIKEHFKTYHKEYIFVGGVVVGVVTGLVIGKVKFSGPTFINTVSPTMINTASPVVNAVSQVTNGGYMHKIVKCLETGQIWETAKDAAEAMGVTPSNMSKHLNGHAPDVKQLHFTIVGLGAGV